MYHLPKSNYVPQQGQFGLIRYQRSKYGHYESGYIEWFNCRDSFHTQWLRRNNETLLYVCNKNNVKKFIDLAEKTLRLWNKTTIHNTENKNIAYIYPAPFWKDCPLRMSLFTILLRAGQKYTDEMEWRETLFEYPYAYETKEAIAYFFAGHTVSKVKHQEGWHKTFAYEHPPMNKMLRRPLIPLLWRKFKGLFKKRPLICASN